MALAAVAAFSCIESAWVRASRGMFRGRRCTTCRPTCCTGDTTKLVTDLTAIIGATTARKKEAHPLCWKNNRAQLLTTSSNSSAMGGSASRK